MNNGADRFFEEMLDSARRAARKDVAQEVRDIKAELAQSKKGLKVAEAAVKDVTKRERAVDKREAAMLKREDDSNSKLKYREHDLKMAEKEIVSLLDQINKIEKEDIVTTTTTARRFVKRSTRGDGWCSLPTVKSAALTAVKRRVTVMNKKESK